MYALLLCEVTTGSLCWEEALLRMLPHFSFHPAPKKDVRVPLLASLEVRSRFVRLRLRRHMIARAMRAKDTMIGTTIAAASWPCDNPSSLS